MNKETDRITRRNFLRVSGLALPVVAGACLHNEERTQVSKEISFEEYDSHFNKIFNQLAEQRVDDYDASYVSFTFDAHPYTHNAVTLIKGLKPKSSAVYENQQPERYPLEVEPTGRTILLREGLLEEKKGIVVPMLQLVVAHWDGQLPKRFGANESKGFSYALNGVERAYVIDKVYGALDNKTNETTFSPAFSE